MSSAETQTPEDEQAAPRDEVHEALLATLIAELGDAVIGSHIEKSDLWVRVRNDAWRRAAMLCRAELECDYFCFLSGIDWMPAPSVAGESEEEVTPEPTPDEAPAAGYVTGYAGGDTRFQVFCRLYSTKKKYGLTLKVDLDEANPTVESLTPVYRGADWHERETWEMFGFDFPGHPHLRHLYLPSQFEGFPLRKDFPLLAREIKPWPGLVNVESLPGEEDGEGDGGEG